MSNAMKNSSGVLQLNLQGRLGGDVVRSFKLEQISPEICMCVHPKHSFGSLMDCYDPKNL